MRFLFFSSLFSSVCEAIITSNSNILHASKRRGVSMSKSPAEERFLGDEPTWFVVFQNGREAGPFSIKQLAAKASEGEIAPNDYVQNNNKNIVCINFPI